jgi:hypothetical protein
MKLSRRVLCCVMLLQWALPAFAQVAPLRLQVIAGKKQANPRANYSTGNDVTRVQDDVLSYYTIELSQAMKPLQNVRVHWAILVEQPATKLFRVIEGEHVSNVPVRDAVHFDTSPIRTGVITRSETSGIYDYGTSSVTSQPRNQIKGYEVEVYVAGQRVIVEVQPTEIQQQIESLEVPAKIGKPPANSALTPRP